MSFLGGGRACIGFKFSQLEISAPFPLIEPEGLNRLNLLSEIVLSLLIKRFKFSPSGKKVVWLCNGVTQPTVEDPNLPDNGRLKTQLPLKVSVA